MGRARKNYGKLLEQKDAPNAEYEETFFFKAVQLFSF